jgi:hypothetical protein
VTRKPSVSCFKGRLIGQRDRAEGEGQIEGLQPLSIVYVVDLMAALRFCTSNALA